MAKIKTSFFCQSCGAQFAKWQGQCTSCKSWNTIAEELVQKPDQNDWKSSTKASSNLVSKPLKISDIDTTNTPRLNTTDGELNKKHLAILLAMFQENTSLMWYNLVFKLSKFFSLKFFFIHFLKHIRNGIDNLLRIFSINKYSVSVIGNIN